MKYSSQKVERQRFRSADHLESNYLVAPKKEQGSRESFGWQKGGDVQSRRYFASPTDGYQSRATGNYVSPSRGEVKVSHQQSFQKQSDYFGRLSSILQAEQQNLTERYHYLRKQERALDQDNLRLISLIRQHEKKLSAVNRSYGQQKECNFMFKFSDGGLAETASNSTDEQL